MRIYLDNIVFNLQRAGGISVYWYELARALQDRADVYFIDSQSAYNNLFKCQLKLNRERLFRDRPLPLTVNRYLPATARLARPALFHSSYYRVALQPGVANIVTVHDFTYEFFRAGLPRLVHRLQKWLALVCADGIICDSENTRSDMLMLYPALKRKRQTVIYLGVNKDFRPLKLQKEGQLTAGNKEQKPLVMFIGDRRPRYKNFKMVVNALKLLRNYHLAIVGGGQLSSAELIFIERHIGKRYQIHRAPDSEALNDLYNRAFCLLYPSLYEGFGLPLLEAMRAGCPVVTTDRASIPEVIGDSGIKLKEITPSTIASAVKRLEDPAVRQKCISSGYAQAGKFSWQRCVNETFDFYQQVYKDIFDR